MFFKKSKNAKRSKMAAPPEVNLRTMDGTQWTFDPSLSGDYGAVLAMQEVNYLIRIVLARTSFALSVKHWKDEEGVERLELENQLSTNLPGITDRLHLDWEPDEFYDSLFGNVRDRTRWVKVADLEEEYQKEGWEEGTEEVIEILTEHLDIDASTSQVCGFEILDGVRHYTRKLVVRKKEECVQIRLTFKYVKTLEKKEEEEEEPAAATGEEIDD